MSGYRRYFIFVLVGLAFGLPVIACVDFFCKQKDRYTDSILTTFNKGPSDVLWFGDSTIRFTGDRDKDKTGIDQFFGARSKLSVCTIASPGFSAQIFSQYVRLLAITRFKPRLVVITVNLRSFSDSLAKRPSVSFPLRRIYTDYRASKVFAWRDYLDYRFLGREDRLTDVWNRSPVVRDGVIIGTNRQVMDAGRIDELLDYAPEREKLFSKQLALKFRYHYLMDVNDNDTMVARLKETGTYLGKLGIPVLLYATPINMQDGEGYVGTGFRAKVENNLAQIASGTAAPNVTFLDLHSLLESTRFVHKKDVFEHLDTEGRKTVGERVADEALKLIGASTVRVTDVTKSGLKYEGRR